MDIYFTGRLIYLCSALAYVHPRINAIGFLLHSLNMAICPCRSINSMREQISSDPTTVEVDLKSIIHPAFFSFLCVSINQFCKPDVRICIYDNEIMEKVIGTNKFYSLFSIYSFCSHIFELKITQFYAFNCYYK